MVSVVTSSVKTTPRSAPSLTDTSRLLDLSPILQLGSMVTTKVAPAHIDTNGVNGSGKHAAERKPNIALFVTKNHEIYQKEVPFPASPGPHDCIVHVRCTGICGSEIHFWKHGHIGDFAVENDLILGHESSGEVIEVGSEVKDLRVGDKVSIEPQVSCFKCRHCLQGRYNLCPNVKFSGTPPTHGTLARYICHPARHLFKLPDNIPYSLGALVEPISVALGGIQRSGLRLGQPLLICGAGPIGMLALIQAKAAGAFPICITDLSQNRLDWAKRLGATCTVLIEPQWDGRKTASRVRDAISAVCPGIEPEIALECTGAQSSVYGATYALRDGGTLMQVGNGRIEQTVPFQSLSMREIDLRFLFRYIDTWPLVLRLLQSGMISGVAEIITHTFSLDNTRSAFEIASDLSSGAVKVQIMDYDA